MPEVIVTMSLEEMVLLGKGKTFEDVVKSAKKGQIEVLPIKTTAVKVKMVVGK